MVWLLRLASICEIAFLVLANADSVLARTWTDNSGKFRLDAEFVSLADGVVTLRKTDGSSTSIPIERLSKSDQEFAKRADAAKGVDKSSNAGSGSGTARSKDVQVIIAEGAGATSDAALKDAFRNAVRQVVGAIVDAELLVKNDEVIEEKVLTYSNGFIKSYDEIPNSKKNQDGIYRIRIKALVERLSILAKLKGANVTVNQVDGKNLFAEITTKLEEEKDADTLLSKALEGFPDNCVEAELIGKPEVLDKDTEKATLKLNIRFKPSDDGCKSIGQRLEPVLERIARKKGDFLAVFRPQTDESAPKDEKFRYFYLITERSRGPEEFLGHIPEVFDGRSFVKGRLAVALNVRKTKLSDRLEFRYFVVDEALRKTLTGPALLRPECKLTFLAADGEVILTERFDPSDGRDEHGASAWPVSPYLVIGELGTGRPYVLRNSGLEEGQRANAFVFSTCFFDHNTNEIHQKPIVNVSRRLQLTLDELKQVSSVKCEVRFVSKSVK